jgi:hypothetical protein
MADNNFTSQGLYGLSHFRNTRAAQELFEPVYNNLFTVQIQLPEGVGSTPESTNLLLEGIRNVGGLQSHSFPTTPASQKFKWAERRFAGAKPDKTTMDVTFDFEVNIDKTPSAYTVKTLRKWCDLVYDPLTGRTGLKADYVADWALITLYDRGARPFWQWKLYYPFPMSAIPEVPLDYDNEDVYKVTGFTLACDFWDETIV